MKTKLSSLITITLLVLTTFATQARADGLGDIIERDFSPRADSLNSVLVRQFLNTARGTFWAVPRNQQNRESATTFIYWQQAHAMDVLVYAYERIKDSNPDLAANYARYMSLSLLPPTATTITPATPVANHKPSTVCDLSGRKVESAQAKGIQIVNGKKKIVR